MGVYFRGRSWCESGSVWIPGARVFSPLGFLSSKLHGFLRKKKKNALGCMPGQWPGQEAIRLMTLRTLSSVCWVIVFKGSRHLAPSLQPWWLLPQISTNRTSQASQFPCYSVGGAGGAGAGASFSSGMRGWRACRVTPSPQHPAPHPGGGSPFPFSCYKPTPTPPAPPVPRPPR